MQSIAHIDPNLVFIIEALVLFFVAAEFIPVISRHLPAWMRSKRPIATTIASATSGLPVPVLAEEENGSAIVNGDGGQSETATEMRSADGRPNPGKEE
jgi:hypothetical protein